MHTSDQNKVWSEKDYAQIKLCIKKQI